MSVSQFRVTCDTYKNNIFCGFSLLQQKQEFVDMTFAAEGHFVKVHQSLVALCSPYIKEMLKSLPGQHPVIILNNVSYEILCFILEYIYTGEVEIPSHKLDIFIKAANSLNLSGIDKLEKKSI
ncbi:unnamed protein product [Parnassius mnemosyne]|uniref:BTB domain-containing protein n=1 Tax=Parnassius mnemosyne TaxID=213953 RepID=A0AAV1LZT6_9NEOP